MVYSLNQPETPTKLLLDTFRGYQSSDAPSLIGLTDRGTALAVEQVSRVQVMHFYEFAVEERRGTDIDNKIAVHRYEVRMPGRAYVEELTLSPQGDRIAWVLVREPKNKELFSGEGRGELWISRVDGSQMHCIGLLGKESQMWKHIDQMIHPFIPTDYYDFPMQVRWLPDGKRLSFLYSQYWYEKKSCWYTRFWSVPAD